MPSEAIQSKAGPGVADAAVDELPPGSVLTRRDGHDITAQVINLKGFLQELRRAMTEIRAECAAIDPPADRLAQLDRLFVDDAGSCIECLQLSVDRLEAMIDGIARSEG